MNVVSDLKLGVSFVGEIRECLLYMQMQISIQVGGICFPLC